MRYLTKKNTNIEWATILEPSVWIGKFLRTKPFESGKATGMEIDKTSWTIAQITNPTATIKIWDFQNQFMDFTGTRPLSFEEIKNLPKYDIVIGNPPYKLRTTKQRNLWDLPKVDRFEDYFMIRWLDMLKPWWIMTVVVPSSFMDKWNYTAKQMLQDRWMLIDAYRLPNKAFTNTDVGTDILVFKKQQSTAPEMMDQIKIMSNWERFKNNPDKILWEQYEWTDQRWKPKMFVKWSPDNVLNIIKQWIENTSTWFSAKIQKAVEDKMVELWPLTITNLVTSKQEIIETPKIEIKNPITEAKKSLITKKEMPVVNNIKQQTWLFDQPTPKQEIQIIDKIIEPKVEPIPEWLSNNNQYSLRNTMS